ncbi:MAG: hypothetical protein AAGD07_16385 [Planctomycetota bacterium]
MARPPFKRRWITHQILPTMILVGSGVAFYALGSRPEVTRKPRTAPRATVVDTAEVRTLDGPLVIETTGEVVPHRVLSIASEVKGRIVFKHPNLRTGENVRAGETLIKIDPQRFALAVQRLQVVLKQTRTGLERTRQRQTNLAKQLGLARKSHQILQADVERIRKLQQSRATSVSEVSFVEKQELDARLAIEQLEGQQRSHEIELAEQELAEELARVQLDEAKLDQLAAEITSPMDGIIIAAPQEEHAMVQAGDQLVSIEESGCLEVHCHLKLDEMAWVWNSRSQRLSVGGPSVDEPSAPRRLRPVAAVVTYNAGSKIHILPGQLIRQHGAGLDETTRTVACRVLVEGHGIASAKAARVPLMTGMFVNVQVRCQPDRSLLQVPEQAIRADGSVWLMRDGKLQPIPVKTILCRKGTAIIESETPRIELGDLVIVSPIANAKEGLPVRTRTEVPDSISRVTRDVGRPAITTRAARVGGSAP